MQKLDTHLSRRPGQLDATSQGLTVGQTQGGARTTEPLGGSGAHRPPAPAQSYRETRADAASAERRLKLPRSCLDLRPS